MRIDRIRVGRQSHYYADGQRIGSDALSVVLKGIFGRKVCAKVFWDLTHDNTCTVERYIGNGNEQLIAQLEAAGKKIAVLEKKVAELTLKNLYQVA